MRYLKAQSIDGTSQGSWISAKPKALNAIKNVIGKSYYKARAGTCTWLNSVYWGEVKPNRNGLLTFSNIADDDSVIRVEADIESDIVFPLLRGREVTRWLATPNYFILVPQDSSQPSKGIPLLTFERRFKKALDHQSQVKHF